MCSLFGWLDCQGIVPHKVLKKLTQSLAVSAETRGVDASGISYVRDGEIVIYKRPKAAHKLHFNPPDGTRAVLGHTRMTTQGSEKKNQNSACTGAKETIIKANDKTNYCAFGV